MELPSAEIVQQISNLSSSRQRYVLEMRLGIDSDRTHTLQEIADKLEVTRERVRQIQHMALSNLANAEVNSMLLVSEISSPSRISAQRVAKKIRKHSNALLRSKQSQPSTDHLIVVNFFAPTKGIDPVDGSFFVADRHKVKAEWARQDGRETLFIADGEVISSWPTKLISGITWPSGIDIPITPIEFASRMEEIKAIFPNAWSKWSNEEELKLSTLFKNGKNVLYIANALGRAPGGIYSRLRKINLIDESIDFSEDLVFSLKDKIRTGTVYELIQNLYQISISPAKLEKVNNKFSEPGWFLMTDKLFKCTTCSKARIIVIRKHWKNMGRVFHRWALTCLECDKTGESREFEIDLINSIHEELENCAPVEEVCPNCADA
jgi:hypothetical protein